MSGHIRSLQVLGCIYRCYFFDFSTAFSEYPELASAVFGFNLQLQFKPVELAKVPLDKHIAATVTTNVKTFLHAKENAVVYICDNSDNVKRPVFTNLPTGLKRMTMVLLFNSKVLSVRAIPIFLMPS